MYVSLKLHKKTFKVSFAAAQRKTFIDFKRTNWLVRFREKLIALCSNNRRNAKIICGQNSELLNVKACGTYSYHCVLKD
jgi:hypothetical protein